MTSFALLRHVYDETRETCYFSVVDIVAALTDQADHQTARKYWNKLAERLKEEGSQVVTHCHRLKFPAADGKKYETDAADVETILRLAQSIKNRTPFRVESSEAEATSNPSVLASLSCVNLHFRRPHS